MPRLVEEVALNFVACVAAQEFVLLRGFDALGAYGYAELSAHRDDRFGDRLVFRVLRDLANERAVDLQRVYRKLLQLRQRRIARAEIVDRETHARFLDGVQSSERPFC